MPNRLQSIMLACCALFLAVILILYPEETFRASLKGLKIWWEVVFPAMLPFFITAELMMGLGVVHLIGTLLEPFMRPIFRVPGAGGFVMAVAWLAGNPMGAKLTARLREQQLISQIEGERLIASTSNLGPLFIFGAVAVGFFESASVGVLLGIAHYGSCLLVGIIMRFYHPSAPETTMPPQKKEFLLFRAIREMHNARVDDGRPIGKLLGDAVQSAVHTLLMIGGFIMLFSVVVHAITHLNLIDRSLEPFFAGIFEITLGSQMISEHTVQIPLIYKLAFVSFFFGWNGLSIQAQIVSILSSTDIRYRAYFIARILHGTLAAFLVILIWEPLHPFLHNLPHDVPTMAISFIERGIPYWDILQRISCMIGLLWLFYALYQFHSKRKGSYLMGDRR